jgi:hypothetical protein
MIVKRCLILSRDEVITALIEHFKDWLFSAGAADFANGNLRINSFQNFYDLKNKTDEYISNLYCDLCLVHMEKLFSDYSGIDDILMGAENDDPTMETKLWLANRNNLK